MAFFPVFVLVLQGLERHPQGSDDVFSVYQASRWQRLTRLSLPSAVPALFLSLRVAAAQCFLIALTAEWLLGQGGLGRVLSAKRVHLDAAGSWATMLCAIVLSACAYGVASHLERRAAARWA